MGYADGAVEGEEGGDVHIWVSQVRSSETMKMQMNYLMGADAALSPHAADWDTAWQMSGSYSLLVRSLKMHPLFFSSPLCRTSWTSVVWMEWIFSSHQAGLTPSKRSVAADVTFVREALTVMWRLDRRLTCGR